MKLFNNNFPIHNDLKGIEYKVMNKKLLFEILLKMHGFKK